jgi:crotonobetainyl-CoA:carnitine CoA-transferase CaiB-like acyl-CoA transferase
VTALDDLRATLDRIFSALSTVEWLDRLATTGVPHGPIYDVAGAFAQPQIRDGDFLGTMETPGGATLAMRTPLLVDGVRPALRRGPRRLGEDTDELFGT